MTTDGTGEATTRAGPLPDRDGRAHRILDAATELVLRWGYDKTTIDDIARTAAVAKGTIYLHWKTREELFAALLRRERLTMLEDARRHYAATPDNAHLRALIGTVAAELLRRPLMKAVFVQDSEVLGKLTRTKRTDDNATMVRSGLLTYLEALRRHRVVRTDLSLEEQVNVIAATLYGFFLVTPLLPNGYRRTDDQLADLVAETVHRTLESDDPVAPEVAAAVSATTLDYLDTAIDVARSSLRESLTLRASGRERES